VREGVAVAGIHHDIASRGVDRTQVGSDREGVPTYYTQIEPNEVILVPCPDDNYLGITPPDPFNPPDPLAPPVIVRRQMRIIAAVQPTVDAAEIDDSLFNYYGEAIAYGARARLVETAGQPYYDPQAAPMLWGRLYGGVSEAKARPLVPETSKPTRSEVLKPRPLPIVVSTPPLGEGVPLGPPCMTRTSRLESMPKSVVTDVPLKLLV